MIKLNGEEITQMSLNDLIEEIKKDAQNPKTYQYGLKPTRLMAGTPENVNTWMKKNQGFWINEDGEVKMEWDESTQSFKKLEAK
jgi:hypothetical protein